MSLYDEDKFLALVDFAENAILAQCEPDDMAPEIAVDYLELVMNRLRFAIEAIKEENPELER